MGGQNVLAVDRRLVRTFLVLGRCLVEAGGRSLF